MPSDGALREVARTRKLPLAHAGIIARVTLHIADDKRQVLDVPAQRYSTVSGCIS